MSNDLISREALKKHAIWTKVNNGAELIDIEVVPLDAIDNAPTVRIDTNDIEYKAYCKGLEDGKKITGKQGEWIYHSDGYISFYTCNKCNGFGYKDDKFCNNCGAKMKGGAE